MRTKVGKIFNVNMTFSIAAETFTVFEKTNLDCLFLLGSSAAKMWTVPWSLDTQMRDASWLKLILENREWRGKVSF